MTTLLNRADGEVTVHDRRAGELSDRELLDAAARLETAPASVVIGWAVENFHPHLCLTASMTDAVVIDLATRVEPAIEVVFIDTGYHFPETLEMVELVRRRYGLNLRVMTALPQQDELWKIDPDNCCSAIKTGQLDRALFGKQAWMSGLRRDDGPTAFCYAGRAPRRARPGKGEPHRHLDGVGRGRLHRGPRCPGPPARQPGVPLHRMSPVHQAGGGWRGSPFRPLVRAGQDRMRDAPLDRPPVHLDRPPGGGQPTALARPRSGR